MVVPKAQLPLFFSTTTSPDIEDDSEVDELQSKSPSAQPGTPPSSPPPNRPSRSKKARRVDKDVGEDGDGEPSAGTPVASRLRRPQQPDLDADDPPSDSSQDVTIRRRSEQAKRSLRSSTSTSTKEAKSPPPTTFPLLTLLPQRAAAQRAQQKITYTAKAEAASKRRDNDWSQYDYVREPGQSSASTVSRPKRKPDHRKKPKVASSSPSPLLFDERLRTLYQLRNEAVDVGKEVCRESGGEPWVVRNGPKGIVAMSCQKCKRDVDDAVFSLEVRHYEEFDGKGQLTAPLWRPVLINATHSHSRAEGQTAKQQKRKRPSSEIESDSDSSLSSPSSCPSPIEGIDIGLEDGKPGPAEQGSVEGSTTPSSSYFAFADDPPRSLQPPLPEGASRSEVVSDLSQAVPARHAPIAEPEQASGTTTVVAMLMQTTAAALQCHRSQDSEGRDPNARSASVSEPPSSNTSHTSQALQDPVCSPETKAVADGLLLFHQAPSTGPTPQTFTRNTAPILPLALGDTAAAAPVSAMPTRIGIDPRKRPQAVCRMDSIRKSQQWVSSVAAMPPCALPLPPPPPPGDPPTIPPPPPLSPPRSTSWEAVTPPADTAVSHGRRFPRPTEDLQARIVVTPPQEERAASESACTSEPAVEENKMGEEDIGHTEACMPWHRP